MKRKLFLLITFLAALSTYAQTELKGRVINSVTKEPIQGVLVTVIGQNKSATTDAAGEFVFFTIAPGEDKLSLSALNIRNKVIPISIFADAQNETEDIAVNVQNVKGGVDVIGVISDEMLGDEGENAQDISSLVVLSNDVYLNNASFQLSPFRFKSRGYGSTYEQKYINGVLFNDQYRGVFNFSSVGALNDLTRNGDVVNFNGDNLFTYGALGGSENINMRAGSYNKGGRATISYTNRTYYLRGMATYSTGLMDNGWAFTGSVGGRYSDEGNIDGTFYRNFSYGLAIEKQWNGGEHSLSFTSFGSPVERGQQSASIQEVYDLVGNNLYNPNWGYQNGKKRNSRVVKAYDPTAILSHVWKLNEKTRLTTGVGFHYQRYGTTALNWYNNSSDPRPDYYRRLPSFVTPSNPDDPTIVANTDKLREEVADIWRSKNPIYTQVNWDQMYYSNYYNLKMNSDSLGQSASYMVEERRSDLMEISANSVLNAIMANNHTLTVGAGFRHSRSKQFKTVDDLLGAPFLRDVDKFAERDENHNPEQQVIIQNNLNNPNRYVKEGDVFGYDFRFNINSANIWLQDQYTTNHIDFYYAAKLAYTDYYRLGKMKNGRYPDNSYGKGRTHTFVDYGLKGGMTYKISGRHYISGNISYQTEAPLAYNAYISPRISDKAVDLESSKAVSADINYVFSLPSLTGRVSVFQTNFYDQVKKNSYYYDNLSTFVNHVLTGVDKVHRGFEIGLDYKVNDNWSLQFAGTMAQYYYSNNPMGTMNSENGNIDNVQERVYMKNLAVGGTPQIAGTFGISYFNKYWFGNLNVNGIAQNYVDVAPIKRMASFYSTVTPGTVQYDTYKQVTHQERFGSAATLDLSLGKLIFLRNRQSISINATVNNLLNRKNIKTGGYEQGRVNLDYPDRFSNKYYYMQGINCFINVGYRF